MQRQLDTLGRQLVWFSLGICGLVFGIGVLRGFAALQMVLRPGHPGWPFLGVLEGLPVIATTTLAFGVEKMRGGATCSSGGSTRSRRSWPSAPATASTTTGTLTVNRMSVAAVALGRCERTMRLGVQGAPSAAGRDQAPARPVEERLAAADRDPAQRDADRGRAGWPAGAERHGHRERARAAGARPGNGCGSVAAGMPEADHPLQDLQAYRFMVTTHRQAGTEELLAAVKGSPEEVLWALRLAAGGRPAAILDPGRPYDGRAAQQPREMAGEACGSSASPASGSTRPRPTRRPRR